MLYNQTDLKVLKEEIEFIDTAVIPFASADMDDRSSIHSNNLELVQLVAMQMEKQFKGRLLVTPPITTVKNSTSILETYIPQLREYGFKNIVVLTHIDEEIDSADYIKLNEIPLADMSNDMKSELINDEVKKVMKFIISVWNR